MKKFILLSAVFLFSSLSSASETAEFRVWANGLADVPANYIILASGGSLNSPAGLKAFREELQDPKKREQAVALLHAQNQEMLELLEYYRSLMAVDLNSVTSPHAKSFYSGSLEKLGSLIAQISLLDFTAKVNERFDGTCAADLAEIESRLAKLTEFSGRAESAHVAREVRKILKGGCTAQLNSISALATSSKTGFLRLLAEMKMIDPSLLNAFQLSRVSIDGVNALELTLSAKALGLNCSVDLISVSDLEPSKRSQEKVYFDNLAQVESSFSSATCR